MFGLETNLLRQFIYQLNILDNKLKNLNSKYLNKIEDKLLIGLDDTKRFSNMYTYETTKVKLMLGKLMIFFFHLY